MLKEEKLIEIVGSSAMLKGVNLEDRRTFIEYGRIRHVDKGALLFHQGEPAQAFFILIEGRLRLTQITANGDQVILQYFGPGDGVGIVAALSEIDYPAFGEALKNLVVLSWDRVIARNLMLQIPRLALNGMEMMAGRFARLMKRYQEMATQRVEQRVAITLLRLVRQFGKRVDDGVLVDIPLSRQDLAEMTGTNVFNVSRILSKWEQDGVVRSGRKKVVLLKAHELIKLIEGD
jgi:CRP-like cAMP-binding protein